MQTLSLKKPNLLKGINKNNPFLQQECRLQITLSKTENRYNHSKKMAQEFNPFRNELQKL